MYFSFRSLPGWSRFARQIAQAQDEIRYPRSKQLADVLQGCQSSLVFHSIMQQRGDIFVLVPPSSRTREATPSR